MTDHHDTTDETRPAAAEDTGTGGETAPAESTDTAADRLTGKKTKKPRASRAKAKAADTPPDTSGGEPVPPGGPGNRDDAAEKDMGTRTAEMGESGASRKDGSKPADTDPTAPARAGETPAPAYPGEGPAVWEGTIKNDAIHGGAFRFRSSENEAEAQRDYLRHRGVRHTTGAVSVTRVEE